MRIQEANDRMLRSVQSELLTERDVLDNIKSIIRENFLYEPFTPADIVEWLGVQGIDKGEKVSGHHEDELVVDIQSMIHKLTKAGFIKKNDDGTYELEERER